MTITNVHRTFIIRDVVAPTLREMGTAWKWGSGMFERPCTDGIGTFFVSSGPVDELVAALFPLTTWEHTEEGWVGTEQPFDIDGLADRVGVTPGDIEALIPFVDISDQPWQVAFERLGLTWSDQEQE